MNQHTKPFNADEIQKVIYQNLNDSVYEKNEADDRIIAGIKLFCFKFLQDNDHAMLIDMETTESSIDFLSAKIDHLEKVKKALNVKTYSWPLTEVSQTIDEYILAEDGSKLVYEQIYAKLLKDVNGALDLVSLCYGIMINVKRYRIKKTNKHLNKNLNKN